MKVWITKCINDGLVEEEGIQDKVFPGTIFVNNFPYYQEGRDWHRTKKAAINALNEMRIRRIESLKKQIKKLEAMEFK